MSWPPKAKAAAPFPSFERGHFFMNVKANTDDGDEALLAEFNLTDLPVVIGQGEI